MLRKEIIAKLEKKLGEKLDRNANCYRLAQAIEDETKKKLSVSSVQRLLGVVGNNVNAHRPSTLDIIAEYLGYPNYEAIAQELGISVEMSDFADFDEIISADLETGTQVQFTYEPERLFVLTYLGDNRYIVNEVYGSKNIQKGDQLRITNLVKGQELMISEIEREGKNLGMYVGGKMGGLTSLEVFK